MEVELEFDETTLESLWRVYNGYDDNGLLVAKLYCHRGYTINKIEVEETNDD